MTVTPAAGWHPDEPALQDYVDGSLTGLSAGSVEAHLLACPACRAQLRDAVPAARLSRTRDALEDRLDRTSRPWTERALVRLGLDEADARALLAAPSLRVAWTLAVVAAALLGLLLAEGATRPDAVFLLVAPLLPLATTALAFAPALDPAFAVVTATPYRTARLLLARSLAVGLTSAVAVALAGLALPARDVTAVVWLLPAAALTLLVLVLAARFGTGPAAAGVGTSWVALNGVLDRRGLEMDWVEGAAAQGTSALLTAVALAVLLHQWARLDGGGRA